MTGILQQGNSVYIKMSKSSDKVSVKVFVTIAGQLQNSKGVSPVVNQFVWRLNWTFPIQYDSTRREEKTETEGHF
jgi:hypothetical protein